MRDLDKDSEVGRERTRVTETEIGRERERKTEGSWEIRGRVEMMNEDGEMGREGGGHDRTRQRRRNISRAKVTRTVKCVHLCSDVCPSLIILMLRQQSAAC